MWTRAMPQAPKTQTARPDWILYPTMGVSLLGIHRCTQFLHNLLATSPVLIEVVLRFLLI